MEAEPTWNVCELLPHSDVATHVSLCSRLLSLESVLAVFAPSSLALLAPVALWSAKSFPLTCSLWQRTVTQTRTMQDMRGMKEQYCHGQ